MEGVPTFHDIVSLVNLTNFFPEWTDKENVGIEVPIKLQKTQKVKTKSTKTITTKLSSPPTKKKDDGIEGNVNSVR